MGLIQDIERGSKSSNSSNKTVADLTGRFREQENRDIEPCEDRNKHHHSKDGNYTIQLENSVLKKKLKDHEKSIDGLTRQHTQLLKLMNTKDKEIERLKNQLNSNKIYIVFNNKTFLFIFVIFFL